MVCPECTSGHIHEGTPTGKEEKIHGRDTYVALPPEGTPTLGTIIIIPDGYGWVFVNNRLLADHYAQFTSCRVLLPDFMDGKSFPTWGLAYFPKVSDKSLTFSNWFWKPYYAFWLYGMFAWWMYNNSMPIATPKVYDFFKAEREANQNTPLGAAGFCWGGCLAFILARDESSPVDTVFAAHPSALELPKDVQGLKKSISVAIGAEDDVTINAKTVHILKEALDNTPGLKSEVKVYEGAGHGFAVRADPDRDTYKQAQEAQTQAENWFVERFKEFKRS